MSDGLYQVQHFVSNESWSGNGTGKGAIFCPANGKQIGEVAFANVADMQHAIDQAEAAFHGWSETSPVNRARVIYNFRQLLIDHMDEIAELISREHGKTFSDAKGEVQRGIDVVEHACGIPSHMRGENSEIGGSGIEIRSYKFPLGVVASITPFNFPVMIPVWLFTMAIACGNTVLVKPSEKVPSSTLRLAELFAEAGLPAGVLNVVQGDKEAVDVLLEDPRVKAVGFVGSTPIANYIHTKGTANGKRVQAFGGAKNHAIVMPDADIDFVADSLTGAAFGAAGERCMAISVAVTVGEDTADRLVEALLPRVQNLNLGPSMDDGDFGPVISAEHRDRVKSYIDIGVEEGADLLVDGRNFVCAKDDYANGYYVGGTLFDKMTPDMRIYKEEIFGPVLGITRTGSYDEALNVLNGHVYGNGAAIFTQNGKVAQHFVKYAQAGAVGVNVPIPVPLSFYTFGGWKDSSFTSHNMNGQDAVQFYTQTKTATVRYPQAGSEGAAFTIPTFDK